MANEIVNRTVNIFIQSGDAQKAYDKLIAKQKALNDQLAQGPKNADKIREELAKLEEPIERAKQKLAGQLQPSLNETRTTASRLRNELSRMSENDPGFQQRVEMYAQANKELETQRGKIGLLGQAWKSFWQEARTVAMGVIVGNTIQAALQTALGYVTGIVTGAAKLSDQLADIQRVTGLTTDEVIKLNSSFKTIDTRTSVSELRDMAIVAGKLGIAKDDILGFVTATDKLKVALGDELGDVNAITTELGKILNVFEGKITGEGISRLGNAIVDLANKGVASGPFLVEFTQRVAGIAKASNLSLGAVIGLAAGMEESGQKVESSSTAIQKLLTTIASDLPKAAKIAGAKTAEEVKQFSDLFAKAPQEALLKYAAGLQKNKTTFAEIASAFKDAGEEGARVISTLATLGQKTDFFKQKINDATTALQGNSEIEEAFRLKNENLGGSLDRLSKNFASLFTSSSFQQGAKVAVNVLNSFVDVIKSSVKFVGDHKLLIATLGAIYAAATVQIKTLTLATIAKNIVEKASAIISAATAGAYVIFTTVVEAFTGRIKLATAAQIIWNTVTSLGAGPLGILLLAIGGIVLATEKLFGSTTRLTAAQRVQAEVAKRVADDTVETQNKIKILTGVLADNNVSLDNRKKALQALIAISPDYLKGLTLENINTAEGKKILEGYNTALIKNAQLKAKSALLDEESKDQAKNTLDLLKQVKIAHLEDQFAGISKEIETAAPGKAVQGFLDLRGSGPFAAKLKEFVQQSEDIKVLTDDLTAAAKKKVEDVTGVTNTGGAAPTDAIGKLEKLRQTLKDLQDQREKATDDKSIATFNKQIKETEDAIAKLEGRTTKLGGSGKKAATDLKSLEEELRQLATSLLPEDTRAERFEKEIETLNDKYAKLRDKAHGNNQLLLQIEQLYQLERQKLIEKFAREDEKNFAEALQNRKEKEAAAARQREQFLNGIRPILEKALQSNAKDSGAIDQDVLLRDQLNIDQNAGKARRDAALKLLDDQKQQAIRKKNEELAALGENEVNQKKLIEDQKAQIEEEFRKKRKELEISFFVELTDQLLNWANQSLQIITTFSDIKSQKENAELARDKAINEKKKANLDKRLKAGLISQLQYDREAERMQKLQDAKEKEIRLKQFKRDQRAQVVQAIMSGAAAVVSTLAARPGSLDILTLGAFRAINIGLTVAATAAQVAKIASEKPPAFARGGKLDGKSHSQGGMAVVDHFGRKQAEVEGDEGIINKFSMRDRTRYAVSGTPSQIASAINARHGGIHWEKGAALIPAWKTQKPQPMNFAVIRKAQHYAAGGQFQKPVAPTGSVEDQMTPVLVGLIASVENLNAQLAEGIVAKMFLTQQEAQQDRIKKIRADATFKP